MPFVISEKLSARGAVVAAMGLVETDSAREQLGPFKCFQPGNHFTHILRSVRLTEEAFVYLG